MWIDLPKPTIIAHRGDSAYAPENTLSAFQQAAVKGADAVEFDVKLTSDRQVIVLHDQKVDRTTNGKGDIRALPFAAVKELDAGVQYPGKFPGEKIPSLEEVFETVGRKLFLNIELTNYSSPNDELVSKVTDLVNRHGLQGRVLFSSFFAHNLQKARRFLPEVPRGLLTMPGVLGIWGRTIGWRADFAALNPFRTDVNLRLVNQIHKAGKLINVWTVTVKPDIERMVDICVDGIITDDPALALNLAGRIV